jgi:hypothetical protein
MRQQCQFRFQFLRSANVDSVVFYDVLPFGMVDRYYVSEELAASIFRTFYSEGGLAVFSSNAGTNLPENKVYSRLI